MPSSPEPRNGVSSLIRSPREPLAVVGIGCRLPGRIHTPSAFWEALIGGVDAICDVPENRWKHERFHDTNPEKSGYIRNARGGFIEGIDMFDADFFGYFPTEAQRIDPQQRLLLEVTHEAMEDAGLRRNQLDGTRTSVFVGSFMYDYLCMQSASEQRDEINPYVAMGTAVSPLANRISYDFNLKGPSVTVDTACSSSLVALHLACQSLWNHEAEMAVAGGVNVMLRPESSILLSKAGFLNPDQYCKAFDASANGYVRGEGVGVVILKPLSKALADGDAVYAVVRGSGVNQDGYLPEGFTVPNVLSQIELLEAVYAEAGIDPLTVDFVEAHGTGTRVGDPVETLSLGAVLGRNRAEGERCLLGSVKTNVGHLEGASGITSFIKAVLAAHHGVVPPNLHFRVPNPEIDWEHINLEVPTRPTPLKYNGRAFTIGVNSFGAGGTNAHVVLQSPGAANPRVGEKPGPSQQPTSCKETLYVLSAAHRDSLKAQALRHAEFLSKTDQRLEDIAFSAFTRRSRYTHQLAIVGHSAESIEQQLRKYAEGQIDASIATKSVKQKKQPQLAFVFSGQGGQWAGMGLRLMQHEPVFRRWMEEIDLVFEKLAGWSLLAEIRQEEGESKINDTVIVQPAVMAIQIALVKLYEHYGIRPAGIVGHSIGEVAAGFAAGALTLQQAVQVIFYRSQAQDRASGKGGMLAVGLELEEAHKLIKGFEGRVSIGAVNGPEMLTLSGDPEPLEQIAKMLETRGVFNRPVRVQVAYHSHHMESIKDIMLDALAEVQGVKSAIPLYSTVSGKCESGEHLTADYWFQNARQPVLYTATLGAMLDHNFDTFVEIGPHPVLVSGSEALFKKLDADALMAPAMTRREPEVTVFLQSLAQLATRGLEPNAMVMFGPGRRYVRLPNYAWQHSRHWFESPSATKQRLGPYEHPFLKHQTQMVSEEGLAVWEATLDPQKFRYLRDHQVDGEIVFPATGHLELAWAVASEQFRHESVFLENLRFDSPVILPENSRHPLEVRLEIVSGEGDYHICTRPADAPTDLPWSKHSAGRINTVHDRFEKGSTALADLLKQFEDAQSASVEQFYENLQASGLVYGENFRCIQQLQHHDQAWLARLQLPDELVIESRRNHFHPALLDACLHVIFADVHLQGHSDRVYLPHRIDRVRFHGRPTQVVWSHVSVTRDDEQYLCSDTLIFSESGELVAEIEGITCKRLVGAGSRQTDTLYDGCYEYQWHPAPHDASLYGRVYDSTTVVLIADPSERVHELAARLAAEGIQPRLMRISPVDSFDELLADVALDRRTLIVFAPGLTSTDTSWNGLSQNSYVPSLLQLAQTLHRREGVPRLCVVTSGAAGVVGDRRLDLGQAVLHGMARVINNECPNVPVTVIDLSESVPWREIDALISELLYIRRDRDESEVAIRGTERLVRTLVAVNRDSAEQAAITEEAGCGGNYRADVATPGALDQIVFRRLPLSEPGDEDVEIAVEAAALNFKDIMNAMGLLPENAVSGGLTAHRLGLEVAGRVLRTGPRVRHVQAGDAVMARVAEGFCGRVITPGHYVVRRPQVLSPQQASAVPLVYVTAWYSLCHLARMVRGETVLIHSAAGGVGGAAIQLAQRSGVTIIATAGTKEKREFLQQCGIEHVFDSRSLDFHNEVMEATEGRGVDIVLNSLSGRFISPSLKCLAPFGRFIELGKSDIYRNHKLSLEQLGENIAYFVVDVDRLAAHKPKLHQQLLDEVTELFERGELKPHEITEFPISKLPEAMRFMTRAAYRGKIVLTMQHNRVQTLPPRIAVLRPARTYLVSGGASGFGLEIAKWMADKGARHLVLLSRSGPKTDADRAAIEAMKQSGIEVDLALADITDLDAVRRTLARVDRELPPLAGVIHGAAVLDDASIPTMDMTRFEHVFNPKAQGAWNLHEATLSRGKDLDFFLMLSSISSVLGLFGQVNYAAANYFQDSLAHYRRQQGLSAVSLNLGVLGQYAGMSSAANDVQDIVGLLETQGLGVMSLADVLGKLEAALLQQPVQRVTANVDWSRFRSAYPHLVHDSRFLDLMSDAALAQGKRPRNSNMRAVLAELEPAERRARLEQELTGKLATILDAPPEKIDVTASIDVLGLDSLMLTDLQIWIVRLLDINLPLIKLLKGPSITNLSADLLAQCDDTEAGDAVILNGASPASESFSLADTDGVRILNPWLIRGRSQPDADFRLFCFHSMGVGASLFRGFLLNPPRGYDILAVQTPGRENRIDEPVAESINHLVDEIVPQMLPLFDRPVVIWGHSFGGIVAREVMRRLRDVHALAPVHFVATGTIAPHLIDRWKNREVILKSMVADNSAEYLISLSRYVDDPELLKAILPGLRRDYPLLKSYRFDPIPPLNFPITAFAARQDDVVYIDEVREWDRHTADGFNLIAVDGDHWFVSRNRLLISKTLQEIADKYRRNLADVGNLSATAAVER